MAVEVALQPAAQLRPAAHLLRDRHPGVVGAAEGDATTHQRLGDRRAADDGKAGRIGDAVVDPLALAAGWVGLAPDNFAGDILRRQLYPDVGFARLHAVVLPIDDQ